MTPDIQEYLSLNRFMRLKASIPWFGWVFFKCVCYKIGPGCSKLTTSLVNVSLKFKTFKISQISRYFFLNKTCKAFALQKLLSFFQQKVIVFGYKVVKHFTSWPLNELVKLTMLWTTGPWGLIYEITDVKTGLKGRFLGFRRYHNFDNFMF